MMLYGLIGKPLCHSFSREIHSLIADYDYELKELDKDEIEPFLRAREFNAINVTIPYKQTVMPYLDFISDEAKSIGAVNTIVKKDGKLFGYNTDFAGMRALVLKNGISMLGKKVLVLGTGGTCKTACAVAKSLGAKQIVVVSRKEKDGAVTYETALREHCDAQIIVNATPVGMYPDVNSTPIDVSAFSNLQGVVDAIYNPLCTNLVLDSKKAGAIATGGLYMLVAQAVYASALFLSKQADYGAVDEVFDEILARKRNVVLVGMPSCGKTTVGKRFADMLGREFADTDEMIVGRIGTSIADFFATHGEKEFRAIEREVVAECAKRSGIVIATGGGVVLDDENVKALKRNGIVTFLDRPLEKLLATSDRPLSSSAEKVKDLYAQRYDKYRACADVRIDASASVAQVADEIRRKIGL